MNTQSYEKPIENPFSIYDIREIHIRGPWKTKSNADLRVLISMAKSNVLDFLQYNESELAKIPQDIRGIRYYSVRGLKKGSVGGHEFHRIRKEHLLGTEGSLDVECEDVYGNKRNFRLSGGNGIIIQPFILHTYETLDDGNLLVFANTLFDPKDPRTHDTYSEEAFRKLQEKYK